MAKVGGPLMSMNASGRFGEMVFDKRNFVRKFTAPSNPQTVAQMLQRNTMGDLQRVLKTLGPVLRAELKEALGYRWNSVVIGELLANGGAQLSAYNTEFTAFTGPQKTDWDTADTSTPVELVAGSPLYAASSAVYDIGVRIGFAFTLTQPAAANSATVGGEWTA